MNGAGHYIIWTIVVSVYLIVAWMLFNSEKGGRCLLGLFMFSFYATVLFDALRVLVDCDPWFPFTVSVIHSSLGHSGFFFPVKNS